MAKRNWQSQVARSGFVFCTSMALIDFLLSGSQATAQEIIYMTPAKEEQQRVSEAQTTVRRHYRYEPPPVAGVQREPTTLTKELVIVGPGVNYDANRGVCERGHSVKPLIILGYRQEVSNVLFGPTSRGEGHSPDPRR